MMQFFAKKSGFNKENKFFIFNSRDFHIRRALIKRGWVENKDTHSSFFNLKYTYKDEPNDYKAYKKGMFFNHFCDNQEITTK